MGCAHCDDSVPHEHVDAGEAAARITERLRRDLRWSLARGVVLAAVLAGTTASHTASLTAAPLGWAVAVPLLAGAAAWVLTTAAGVVVAGLVHRPGSSPAAAWAAIGIGHVATAAATPVAALLVALVARTTTPGAAWWSVAAWAGCGWLGAAFAADVVAAVRMRALLLSSDRDGENARAAVLRNGAHRPGRSLAGTAVGAALLGAWVGLLVVLPVLVLALAPLHAAVAARFALTRAVAAARSEGATRRRVPVPPAQSAATLRP